MKVLYTLSVFVSLWFLVSAKRDHNVKTYKIVCYLGSWANYRPGMGTFKIENIDPHLCTHIVYAFAKLENNAIEAFDPWLDLSNKTVGGGLDAYRRFNDLRNLNPELTTLIAIGGWNEGSIKYSNMAADPNTRQKFVKSVVEFLYTHNFDGFDVDWEYPANRGGIPEDKENFVSLLRELKRAFEPYGYVLTAAVSANPETVDTAYDVPAIAELLDFISVMTYDYHGGSFDSETGHNAPLDYRVGDKNQLFNIKSNIGFKGAPNEKN